jgi:hypothetical protein
MPIHFDSSCLLVSVRKPPDIPAHPRQGKRSRHGAPSFTHSCVAAEKDRKTTQDAPYDLADFHGAPPFWRATLARQVNGRMMGKLLFGKVGGLRKAVQGSMFQVQFNSVSESNLKNLKLTF